jgi:membrane protein required for colicin V production
MLSNVLDWIIVIILLFFLIKSIIRGAAREIFSLLALFLAGFCSCKYSVKASTFLEPFISQKWTQNIVAFAILFLSIYLLVNLAGWLIYKLIKTISLSFLDRTIGALIGAAKAYILACFLIFFISLFPQGNNLLKSSVLASYCFPFIALVKDLFPEELKIMIDEKTKAFKKKGFVLKDLTA